MKTKTSGIIKVEEINSGDVRLTFANGSTLRMSRTLYQNGNWKKGTSLDLVRAING